MRPENNPIEGRQAVANQIDDPSLGVAASPVNTASRPSYEDTQLNNLTNSLNNFTGATEKSAAMNQQRVIENEQHRALMDTVKTTGQKPAFTGAESQWYQEERMKLFGENQKAQTLIAANTAMDALRSDPKALSEVDPTAFVTDFINKNVGQVDDPTVAGIVYPALQSHMPSMVNTILTAKRAQAKAALDGAKEAVTTGAYQFVGSNLGGTDPITPERLWPTFDQTGAMLSSANPEWTKSEVEAATVRIFAQQAENNISAVGPDGKRNLGGADFLTLKDPRNGWSLRQYAGSDEKSLDKLNKSETWVNSERQRITKDDADRQKIQDADARTQQMAAVHTRIREGILPTPDIRAQMTNTEWETTAVMIGTQQAAVNMKGIARGIFRDQGMDNVSPENGSKELLQKEWDNETQERLQAAPFNAADNGVSFVAAVAGVVDMRSNNRNHSANLNVLKTQLSGSEQQQPPSKTGGVVTTTIQRSYRAWEASLSNRSILSNLDDIMTTDTQEFNRIIHERMTNGETDMGAAVEAARSMFTPEAKEMRRISMVAGLEEKVFTKMKNNLDNEKSWFGKTMFSHVTPAAEMQMRLQGAQYLKSALLTSSDVGTLAAGMSAHLLKSKIAVPDSGTGLGSMFDGPDGGTRPTWKVVKGILGAPAQAVMGEYTGSFGRKDRFFARVDAGALAARNLKDNVKMPYAFDQESFPQAIQITERSMNEAFNASGNPGNYTLAEDITDPLRVMILKNGTPIPERSWLPVSLVWNTYTTHSEGGLLKIPKVKMDSMETLKAESIARVRGSYDKTQQSISGTSKQKDGPMNPIPTMSPGKKGPTGYAIPEEPTLMTPKVVGKASAPRSAGWTGAGLPDLKLPPVTSPGAVSKAPSLSMGLPPLIPPPPRG